MEIIVGSDNTDRMMGLSHGDLDGTDTDIDYAFHLDRSATLNVKGQGTSNGSVSAFQSGDVLRIESRADRVYFFQNGVLRDVSEAPPTFPLGVDTSLYAPDTRINPVALLSCSNPLATCSDFGPWENPFGVRHTDSSLRKVGGRADWNAGASSVATISCLDGFAEATVTEMNTARMFGLGIDDQNQDSTDIEWALYLRTDNQLEVRESGAPIAIVGPYQTGDILRVSVQPHGTVDYYRNGSIVHTSSVVARPDTVMRLDTSFFTPDSSLSGLRVINRQVAHPLGVVCWKNMIGI